MGPPGALPAPSASPLVSTSGMDNNHELAATILNFYEVLRRGWRPAAVAVVVCLALAGVYLLGARRYYAATARLLILQRVEHPLSDSKEGPDPSHERFETFLPTQMAILQSP